MNSISTQQIDSNKQEMLLKLKIIGKSQVFQDLLKRISHFSNCDAPVLIEGETGTGKELFARAIHYLSRYNSAPFIPINCGALPDTLIENELFGHAKGAYTDARQEYTGLVAQANGGTLFLDEVEALTAKAQVTLLRLLQDKEYRPLGASKPCKANIRIIAASNVSLQNLKEEGSFREDLWYRLNIMPLFISPLRQRREDILPLIEHFMCLYQQQYDKPGKHLHKDTIMWMLQNDWPGNVRELENFLHREFLLAEQDCIQYRKSKECCDAYQFASIWKQLFQSAQGMVKFSEAKSQLIEQFEKDYLANVMELSHGNVSLAAKWAGKERRAFGKLLKKHGITRQLYI